MHTTLADCKSRTVTKRDGSKAPEKRIDRRRFFVLWSLAGRWVQMRNRAAVKRTLIPHTVAAAQKSRRKTPIQYTATTLGVDARRRRKTTIMTDVYMCVGEGDDTATSTRLYDMNISCPFWLRSNAGGLLLLAALRGRRLATVGGADSLAQRFDDRRRSSRAAFARALCRRCCCRCRSPHQPPAPPPTRAAS